MGSKSKEKSQINKLLKQAANIAVPEAKEWFFGMKDQNFISPERQEAMDNMRNIAQTSTIPASALSEYSKILEGGYLDEGNPYLDENIRRSVSGAMAAPISGYSTAGRFGSGAMANAQMDVGMATESRMRGENYEAERGRMMEALGMTNQMDQAQYSNAKVLADLAREQEQLAPKALNQFMALLTANPLMQERTVTTKTSADVGSIVSGVGGALMGCHVAAEFYGWFTPNWWDARNWIVEGWQGDEAEEFREVYLREGEDLAKRVREDDGYRERLRPMFEWAREQGSKMRGGE